MLVLFSPHFSSFLSVIIILCVTIKRLYSDTSLRGLYNLPRSVWIVSPRVFRQKHILKCMNGFSNVYLLVGLCRVFGFPPLVSDVFF